VTAVGRNDPCPCGSGLKLKRCCLNKQPAVLPAYRPEERNSALARLVRFAGGAEFDAQRTIAFEDFWGDWLDDEPEDRFKELMRSESVSIAFNSWFAYDFELPSGGTVFDLFVEREAKQFSSGELAFLDGMRASHLRLYEVLEVKLDQGLAVRDLWDDRQLFVRERAATQQLVAWDVIAGRIGKASDGELIFETLPYLFPAAVKDDLMKSLRTAHKRYLREFPDKGIEAFFKAMVPLIHQIWVDRVAMPPRPKIVTGDGEPMMFAKVIFDLLDREAAIGSLAARDDIVTQTDGSYLWIEPAGEMRRSIGVIFIEEKRVVCETMSQRRAERARDEFSALWGGAARFRAIGYEGIEQALKHAPQRAEKRAPEIPDHEQEKLLGEFYERHYRKWIDESLPALGGRTPRHAATLKTIRPKLIALLKDFESQSERQRRAGQIAYDFRWMWAELGLNRE
jgi:SEC-C motif